MGNTIDGNIFNKHNDQEKKTLVKKDLFHLHGIYSIQSSVLISSCNFDVEKYSLSVYNMYAMNIQNDVIGLVLRENCKSKQVIDFIAWPSRCHGRIYNQQLFLFVSKPRFKIRNVDWNICQQHNNARTEYLFKHAHRYVQNPCFLQALCLFSYLQSVKIQYGQCMDE